MLLTELFDRDVPGVKLLPPEGVQEFDEMTGAAGDTKQACIFEVGEQLYLAYFAAPDSFQSGSYHFAFCAIDEHTGTQFGVLGRNINAVEVYNKVGKAFQLMLQATNADVVVFGGQTERQDRIYQTILSRVKNRLPGYEIDAQRLIVRKKSPPTT